jgi:hypothetical protein
MKKPTTVSTTVTIPADSPAWGIRVTLTPNPPGTPGPSPPASPAPPELAKTKPAYPVRYAAAVLEGQDDAVASIAPCFDSDSARIKKQRLNKTGEGWILESSDFAACTTGDEVLKVADSIVSRIHQILSLYCNSVPILSTDCIIWNDGEGKPFRTLRGTSIPFNFTSTKGLAELRGTARTQPLGSAILDTMKRDSKMSEVLTLHGDDGLSWSQIYDIIDAVGGVRGIVKAGYAKRRQANIVRQTANHHRHLGSRKKPILPAKPPTLSEANEFARSLLKRWISARL